MANGLGLGKPALPGESRTKANGDNYRPLVTTINRKVERNRPHQQLRLSGQEQEQIGGENVSTYFLPFLFLDEAMHKAPELAKPLAMARRLPGTIMF